jgi:tetratricopeptide (TPR) repeat protein
MGLIALHESYLDSDYLEEMAKQVDPAWKRQRIDELVVALANVGLLRDVGENTYEIHPLLTSYLRSRGAAPEACQRAFVDVMGRLADQLAPREYYQQRVSFLLHGANFHFALQLSQRLAMDQHFVALTRSLAAYAHNSRNLVEASRLYSELAVHWAARGETQGEAAAYHQLGTVALEQWNFATAREWYLKCLAIREKHGDLQGAAGSYHQLGRIAEEQGDFATAREWYVKSLGIKEKHNPDDAATTYGQLGTLAQRQRDFAAAREWYRRALAIFEEQGDLKKAESTYHNLGVIALEQRDLPTARKWYLKALDISEKEGILDHAAMTYHQLGRVAHEQRDFAMARDWYLKSLAIKEKQGNLHGTASTYGQLGNLAARQGNFQDSGKWYARSITAYRQTQDLHTAEQVVENFLAIYQQASPSEKEKLKAIWAEAELGSFPESA